MGSYSISIIGHKDHASAAEAEEFEARMVDITRRYVEELDCVLTAVFSGGYGGNVSIKSSLPPNQR